MRSLRTWPAGAVLTLTTFSLIAPAMAVPLSDLVNPNTPAAQRQLEIGDKLFSNFAVTITGVPQYYALASNIDVIPIEVNGTYGLKFTAVNPAAPMILAYPGGFADVLLDFDVNVTNPAYQISAVSMSFTGQAVSGLAQIVETVYGGGVQPVQIQVGTLGPVTDTAQLAIPVSAIHVTKDIMAIGPRIIEEAPAPVQGNVVAALPTTDIDEFTQLFIQVPEPASVSLLAIGALALLRRRVTRRHTALILAVGLGVTGMLMQPSTASAVALSDLNGTAQTLPYGDFTFSNFHFNITSNVGSNFVDPTAIDVQGFTTPNGSEDGLRFAGTMAALSNMTPGSTLNITISYDVALTNPVSTIAIDDVSMSFNGSVIGVGGIGTPPALPDGKAWVGKTVSLQTGLPVGALAVWDEPTAVQPRQLEDHTILTGGPYTTSLHVSDQIVLEGGRTGAATISFINQTFSLVPIPEPAMALMAVLGLPMLLSRRRAK